MRLFSTMQSSVARRIRAAFVAAAALPLLLLAGVSYYLVSDQLQERALRDAHSLAKDIGMAVYDRLKFVGDELMIFRHQRMVHTGEPFVLSGLDLKQRTHGLFRVESGGEIKGDVFLGAEQRAKLLSRVAQADPEKSLIVMSGTSTLRRLFLLIPHAETVDNAHWLGAELNTEYLWNTSDAAERPERICVLDPNEMPVYCNHAEPTDWLAASSDLMRTRTRPRSLVLDSGESVLTAAWSLYLKPHYQFERWTVLAGVPQSMALSTIRAFDRIFAAVAVLALLLAYFLGSRMIRSNLQPLDSLGEATRQLADGRFAYRVTLDSGDEFQELGEAFNGMASQIGRQFDELGTLARLERSLQGALSLSAAVAAGATALTSLLGPGRSAVLCQEHWEAKRALWHTTFKDDAVSQAADANMQDFASVERSGRGAELVRERPYVQLAGDGPTGALRLTPVVDSRDVKAEILLLEPQPEDSALVTRIADVMATALSKLVMDQRLRYQASHDWLTGLLNRPRMNELFDEWARDALGHHGVIGILALNLDRFKQVNDAHGHVQADQLLIKVARRLSKIVPAGSMLSRFGSDEFVMMIRAADHYQLIPQITAVSEQISVALDRPIRLAHREVRLSASMGAAIFPRHGDCFQMMLQSTDAALRAAKASRRGSLLLFSTGMRDALVGRMDIEQALKGALSNNEIVLHYQPVVDAKTGMTVSAEALMRWQRPGVGLVRPDGFIGVAEESGLIVEFGGWALAEMCRQLQAWRQSGCDIDTVAVNVSGVQLSDPGFENKVQTALLEANLHPRHLTLEVTESALIGQFEESAARLTRLREFGIKVMVDDFGTGYASFKYLKLLPVDGLKIDRLFVKDLPDSERDVAIVSAVVSLAESADLKLVAEGIETDAQASFLRAAGVRNFQGFLFGRGLPAEEFEQRLTREMAAQAAKVMSA